MTTVTLLGACAVVDIDPREGGPDILSLRGELAELMGRASRSAGVHGRELVAESLRRMVLGFEPHTPPGAALRLLVQLADLLDVRNRGLDLRCRLRIAATVGGAREGHPRIVAERIAASALLARVLTAARTSSSVIALSDDDYGEGVRAVDGYCHVRSTGDSFWIRVPGQSSVPGLAPYDLVTEPNSGTWLSTPHGRRAAGLVEVTIAGGDRPTREPADDGGTGQLSGHQTGTLRRALVEAYPSFEDLSAMVFEQLRRNLHRLVGAHLRLDIVAGHLIRRAEAEGWVGELVTGAYLGNPGNPTLARMLRSGLFELDLALLSAINDPTGPAQEFLPQAGILDDLVADSRGDAASPWAGSTLERIFRRCAGFQDVLPFTSRLLAAAAQVCRIEIHSSTVRVGGTGFLVGPDLVLTNHHVVAMVIGGVVSPTEVRCVFDHHVRSDGAVHSGDAFELVRGDGWLVAASPSSKVDTDPHPTELPAPDELDYALIRLANRAGDTTSIDGRRRHWMCLSGDAPTVEEGLPLLIVQHPLALPQKPRWILTVCCRSTPTARD